MKRHILIASMLTAMCGVASAQTYDDDDNDNPTTADEDSNEKARTDADSDKTAPPNDGDLPKPQSDNDKQPEVATPATPASGLVEQAGVGGLMGYGRVGVLELGGSASFMAGGGMSQVGVAPSIGWFAADNLELSAIMEIQHVDTGADTGTIATVLAEPSYHLPFNKTTFAFLGVGIGGAYVKGPGLAFAMAPRLGANFLVGRSGVLTPAISWQYNTHDSMDTANGVLLQVSSAVRANIGYTVMW
jgi:hypothetical protein